MTTTERAMLIKQLRKIVSSNNTKQSLKDAAYTKLEKLIQGI
jgi:hypothetical protein